MSRSALKNLKLSRSEFARPEATIGCYLLVSQQAVEG